MKKLIFPVILLLIGFTMFQSCDETEDAVKDLATFKVNYDLPAVSFELDSALFKSEEVILAQTTVSVNIDSILEANNVSSGMLEGAQFTKVTVEILSPDGANFDFVDNMRVTVAMNSDFSDENQIAETGNIQEGSTSVDFIFDNTDLSAYMTADNFHSRLYGTLNGPVPFGMVGMQWLSSVQITIQPLN